MSSVHDRPAKRPVPAPVVRWYGRLLWLALLLGGWELIRFLTAPDPNLYPSLGEIGRSLGGALLSLELPAQVALSVGLVLGGLLVGVLLAMVLTAFSVRGRSAAGLVSTLVAIFHPLPGIALLPLVILWLGTGWVAVVAVIVHSVLWPVTTNLLAGIRTLPRSYRIFARNLELSHCTELLRVVVPAVFPFLLAGLKIGWARAWRALISAEMVFGAVAGLGGLGWFIFSRRVFMDTAGLFAGITVVVVIGIAVEDGVFGRVERRTVQRWGM